MTKIPKESDVDILFKEFNEQWRNTLTSKAKTTVAKKVELRTRATSKAFRDFMGVDNAQTMRKIMYMIITVFTSNRDNVMGVMDRISDWYTSQMAWDDVALGHEAEAEMIAIALSSDYDPNYEIKGSFNKFLTECHGVGPETENALQTVLDNCELKQIIGTYRAKKQLTIYPRESGMPCMYITGLNCAGAPCGNCYNVGE